MNKKCFTIWKHNPTIQSPIGPWEFKGKVFAENEEKAKILAFAYFGIQGEYKIYEGFAVL